MAYNKTDWTAGDVIDEAGLDKIENQLGLLSDGDLFQASFSRVIDSTGVEVSQANPLIVGHLYVPVPVGRTLKLKRVRWHRSYEDAFEGISPAIVPIESFPNEDVNGYGWLEDRGSSENRRGYAERLLDVPILDASYSGVVGVAFYDSSSGTLADVSCSVWLLFGVE